MQDNGSGIVQYGLKALSLHWQTSGKWANNEPGEFSDTGTVATTGAATGADTSAGAGGEANGDAHRCPAAKGGERVHGEPVARTETRGRI